MRKNLLTAAAAAALVAFGAGTGWVAGRFAGGAYLSSDYTTDTLEIEGSRLEIGRTLVLVPQEFGELKAVIPRSGGSSLWFDAGGVLRNVDVPAGLFIVRRAGKLLR